MPSIANPSALLITSGLLVFAFADDFDFEAGNFGSSILVLCSTYNSTYNKHHPTKCTNARPVPVTS
jgi:hypothetical protein